MRTAGPHSAKLIDTLQYNWEVNNTNKCGHAILSEETEMIFGIVQKVFHVCRPIFKTTVLVISRRIFGSICLTLLDVDFKNCGGVCRSRQEKSCRLHVRAWDG